MRVFLAVFPPAEVRETALAHLEALRLPGDGVAWVKPENLHYTLRFLGEIDDDGARRAIEAAREAAAATASFPATLGAAGAFPSPRRARVIWLGLAAGGPQLVALAMRLETALGSRGIAPEGRPFSPHLTIGRVREPGPDWTPALAAAVAPTEAPATFTVERLDVIRSQLHPRGSIYTVLESAPLPQG